MPKLERWIIAAKKVEVLDPQTVDELTNLGAVMGEGWYDTHQHVCVNPHNKERIEDVLRTAGYTIYYASDRNTLHPELHPQYVYDGSHDPSRPENADWLVVSRVTAVLDKDTLRAVLDLGGQIGGGWCEVHQHIRVDGPNRGKVQELLLGANLIVTPASQQS